MRVQTERFVKKPLYVQAVQVTDENFTTLVKWCRGKQRRDDVPGVGSGAKYIKVEVHNPRDMRQTKAYVGDWILQTPRGFKIYTDKNFRENFDPVRTAGRV